MCASNAIRITIAICVEIHAVCFFYIATIRLLLNIVYALPISLSLFSSATRALSTRTPFITSGFLGIKQIDISHSVIEHANNLIKALYATATAKTQVASASFIECIVSTLCVCLDTKRLYNIPIDGVQCKIAPFVVCVGRGYANGLGPTRLLSACLRVCRKSILW